MDGCPLTVEMPTPQLFSEVDIAFIAASADVSRELAPIAAGKGALVVDDSSAFRMEPEVPLVVPEVNGDDLERHRGIVSIPNCSTTPLVMVLRPLNDAVPITRVTVATYQSVSGTGGAAMEELRTQSGQVLQDCPTEPDAYPHQIAFNALPQVETFTETGYTTEEMKMVHETRKILHLPELAISANLRPGAGDGRPQRSRPHRARRPHQPVGCEGGPLRFPRYRGGGTTPNQTCIPCPSTRPGGTRSSWGAYAKTCPIPTASRCGSFRTTSERARPSTPSR